MTLLQFIQLEPLVQLAVRSPRASPFLFILSRLAPPASRISFTSHVSIILSTHFHSIFARIARGCGYGLPTTESRARGPVIARIFDCRCSLCCAPILLACSSAFPRAAVFQSRVARSLRDSFLFICMLASRFIWLHRAVVIPLDLGSSCRLVFGSGSFTVLAPSGPASGHGKEQVLVLCLPSIPLILCVRLAAPVLTLRFQFQHSFSSLPCRHRPRSSRLILPFLSVFDLLHCPFPCSSSPRSSHSPGPSSFSLFLFRLPCSSASLPICFAPSLTISLLALFDFHRRRSRHFLKHAVTLRPDLGLMLEILLTLSFSTIGLHRVPDFCLPALFASSSSCAYSRLPRCWSSLSRFSSGYAALLSFQSCIFSSSVLLKVMVLVLVRAGVLVRSSSDWFGPWSRSGSPLSAAHRVFHFPLRSLPTRFVLVFTLLSLWGRSHFFVFFDPCPRGRLSSPCLVPLARLHPPCATCARPFDSLPHSHPSPVVIVVHHSPPRFLPYATRSLWLPFLLAPAPLVPFHHVAVAFSRARQRPISPPFSLPLMTYSPSHARALDPLTEFSSTNHPARERGTHRRAALQAAGVLGSRLFPVP